MIIKIYSVLAMLLGFRYSAIILLGLGFVHLPVLGATLSVEVYRFSQITEQISSSDMKIDLYVDGNKVLSEKSCPFTIPCKIDIEKKALLSICESKSIAMCKTSIAFDPAQSPNQKYGFLINFSGYALMPFTVFNPTEMPVLNEYLQRQRDAEKQRDEMKNRVIN